MCESICQSQSRPYQCCRSRCVYQYSIFFFLTLPSHNHLTLFNEHCTSVVLLCILKPEFELVYREYYNTFSVNCVLIISRKLGFLSVAETYIISKSGFRICLPNIPNENFDIRIMDLGLRVEAGQRSKLGCIENNFFRMQPSFIRLNTTLYK